MLPFVRNSRQNRNNCDNLSLSAEECSFPNKFDILAQIMWSNVSEMGHNEEFVNGIHNVREETSGEISLGLTLL
ncbi:hypothetical protein TNCT_252881 [Trichonephila clavata]|uniref:Uncharacterized protein n=1 Tax=Trichonephila clavata TaxID=2740835 RepID=A0A8X6IST2_TRICU|nr:hypothetical protein TNCT_252881 [Trichonephila clavata]